MYDTIPYSSHHPLLHTLFCGGLITLGYKIDDSSLSLGLFLFSFCFYTFCPVVVMFAMSPTKDVLCYAFLLMAFLQLNELYSILEEAGRAAFRKWFMPGVVVSCILINKGLLLALDAEPGEVDEALCVPYQQIARLYVEKGEDAFTEEEYQLLGRGVPPENLLCYDPVMADGIKANFTEKSAGESMLTG